jgi:hypothetical protein
MTFYHYVSVSVALVVAIVWYKKYKKQQNAQKRRKTASLAGKIVAVTGGGSGIGQELAVRLAAQEGATVFILDVNAEGMRLTKERIESSGGKCQTFPCDVSKKEQVYELVRMIESKDMYIDVLINNAGVSYKKPFVECSDEEMEKTFRVNVFAHFYTIKACLPAMVERGGKAKSKKFCFRFFFYFLLICLLFQRTYCTNWKCNGFSSNAFVRLVFLKNSNLFLSV